MTAGQVIYSRKALVNLLDVNHRKEGHKAKARSKKRREGSTTEVASDDPGAKECTSGV